MSSENLDQEIRDLVADVLELPAAEVGPGTSPKSHPAWTSLRHLNLMLAVEESYGVTVPPEEGAKVASVADLIALVKRKTAS